MLEYQESDKLKEILPPRQPEAGASNCYRTNYQAIENNIVSGDETPCVGLTRLPPLR